MTRSNVNNRKKVAVIVVAVLIIAALVSGTYAWRDYSQHKTNVLGGVGDKYDVTLSEDFISETDWKVTDPPVTKAVNVTNNGKAEDGYGNVYVRVGLQELFELRPQLIRYAGTKINDPDANLKWYSAANPAVPLYKNEAGEAVIPTRFAVWPSGAARTGTNTSIDSDYIINTDVNATAAELVDWLTAVRYPTSSSIEWHTDAVSGEQGYFIVTKDGDINGQYGKYLVTAIAYGDPTYLADSNTGSPTPVLGTGAHQELFGDKAEAYWQPHIWGDTPFDTDVHHEYVQLNYKFAENFMLLSEWKDTDYKPVKKWILDDSAAPDKTLIFQYAYWGEALKPQETTSNLIESLELIKQPEGKFQYALNVNLEAASLSDLIETSSDPESSYGVTYYLFGKNVANADTRGISRYVPVGIIDAYIKNAKVALTATPLLIGMTDTGVITIKASLGDFGSGISDVKATIDFPAVDGLAVKVKTGGDPDDDSGYISSAEWLAAANAGNGFLLTETPLYIQATTTGAAEGDYPYTITITKDGKAIATVTGELEIDD